MHMATVCLTMPKFVVVGAARPVFVDVCGDIGASVIMDAVSSFALASVALSNIRRI